MTSSEFRDPVNEKMRPDHSGPQKGNVPFSGASLYLALARALGDHSTLPDHVSARPCGAVTRPRSGGGKPDDTGLNRGCVPSSVILLTLAEFPKAVPYRTLTTDRRGNSTSAPPVPMAGRRPAASCGPLSGMASTEYPPATRGRSLPNEGSTDPCRPPGPVIMKEPAFSGLLETRGSVEF